MELEYVLMIVAIFAILGIIVKIILDEEKAREIQIQNLIKEGHKVVYIYKY